MAQETVVEYRHERTATPERRAGAVSDVLVHLALLALAAIFLVPLAWVICASLKSGADLFSSLFLPWGHLDRLTLRNFRRLIDAKPVGLWLANSIFVASTYTVLTVLLSSLGGFALAKYRFRGKRLAMLVMLATMLVPAQVLLPGSYDLMRRLNWLDSYLALIVPGAVSVFGIFLFRQAMLAIPDEMLQAARIDGCSEIRLWWDISLPIVRPMVGAYTLLSFLGAWNSFLWPQVVLRDPGKYTMPIALAHLSGLAEYQQDYGLLMAATLTGVVPVVILFFALQRDFVSGLASGAVKG